MKKIFLLTVMVAAAFALGVTGARADIYQFMPTTQVESYKGSVAVSWNGSDWHYVIEDLNGPYFDIAGANLVDSTLSIFTAWPGSTFTYLGAVAADLTLYSGGKTWMVRLDNGLGTLFLNPTDVDTSVDKFKDTRYIYGGAYDHTGQLVPVWANNEDTGETLSVTWTDTHTKAMGMNGLYEVYKVDVKLSDIPDFDTGNFSFLYASATCANSVLTGQVPLPASALLLGTGIIGLAGLGWRRRKKS